ncbi:threonine-phosphate decarboxylase CobD [Aminobacter carboxidus]|uniref:threonine-phosphate decarboxylase n=1 Tax=Aminobacter carboxidus TaxID=376165 RepID=A0ABR9GSX9_9HYPH|nr:threonine-phosphate decarboxylase CobD [Aminobacter carboxidus]MBE1206791.1 threonine-phosphate decarboxylase [Aminobacter carboxidus]
MTLLAGRRTGTVDHGGSLDRARALFPGAPEPFVDLSTGINPNSYPLFELPATALSRLPEPSRARDLAAVAATAYGALSAAHVVPAPGTQILLPRIASLVRPGHAFVLGPTYQEHARAAAIAGHQVAETRDFGQLFDADLAVVVNPNNPDGRVVQRKDLLELAAGLRARGGLLVVDEAFMDVGPQAQSLAGDVEQGGLVVLRSFGKFYGLAGIRLGFALAHPDIAGRLEEELGPWSVAVPSLEYGIKALSDADWQREMRTTLAHAAHRLDQAFARAGVIVTGGTSLFRHVDIPDAAGLFKALGREGILVRSFADRPTQLRCGLPGHEVEWRRLDVALGDWAQERQPVGEGAVS